MLEGLKRCRSIIVKEGWTNTRIEYDSPAEHLKSWLALRTLSCREVEKVASTKVEDVRGSDQRRSGLANPWQAQGVSATWA